MVEPNLLVTYDPAHKASAREEVEGLMKAKREAIKFFDSKIDGVFEARVRDPRKIVKSLANLCRKSPERFSKTFRWIPVDRWSRSSVRDMQKEVERFVRNIKLTEPWKMELNKRRCKGDTVKLILKLTDVVNRPKVDLKNPKKIINIEILGNRAGLSLLRWDERFSVNRIRQ